MHRHGQHVADAQPRMGLVGRLAVDADRALGHQRGTVAALPHEPRAPQPLVQALPVAVLLLGDSRPLALQRRQRGERTMGPCRRRFGHDRPSSAAAAGAWPAPADQTRPPPGPPAGTMRKPRRRSTTGSNRPSARTGTPGPPAWRSHRAASPRPVRRRPSRRCRAAAAPDRPPASPWHRRSPAASPAGAAARPGQAAAVRARPRRAARPTSGRAWRRHAASAAPE